MTKNFHNGTNIFAKHNTIFQGEESLEFFMAPTVNTRLGVLAQTTSSTWGLKFSLLL
jgi:hypothetical protein